MKGINLFLGIVLFAAAAAAVAPQRTTAKPVLHGRHWAAITGKPLAATAGAMMFERGGNAIDAACAMLAAVCTMWDTLSWGGETQALIYNPRTRKVIALNGLGVAPTGATPEFFKSKGFAYPPAVGPLAAITPGTPGGLMTMLAEFGMLSLKDVLGPAIQMAEGYPMDLETAERIERSKEKIKDWRMSRLILLPRIGGASEGPVAGEIFRQPDLADTLRKLVAAEREALADGMSRAEAIEAASRRFYRGDIARELVRGAREEGALITMEDLARWRVLLEEPVRTNYKGIEVCKLSSWTQGPVMLQALNMLETIDLKGLGYNTAPYIHTLVQVMHLAFADRDFYYGDPYAPPEEPLAGLLSKAYARERVKLIDPERNDPDTRPGDPYPFQGQSNPFRRFLDQWPLPSAIRIEDGAGTEAFFTGTTSIQAADEKGWVVSVTPSGGWVPAVIGGRTGIGLSQRAQSFVLDEADGPFNVIAPGKRPRTTLTPGLALKDGKPFLSFAVQGGDTQDQNLLQLFLNVVEFGMNIQEACEAANVNSFQMRSSFDDHKSLPGRLEINERTPAEVREKLKAMGYNLSVKRATSGPLNALFFDAAHGTIWGGSSNYGDDYGVIW
jgi:gamma-glutamyltranspeptidase / glutathione hydrolase